MERGLGVGKKDEDERTKPWILFSNWENQNMILITGRPILHHAND